MICVECKNIFNQNFINIFLPAKISSSIITLIEWIISLSVCAQSQDLVFWELCYWQVRTRYYTSTVLYSWGKIFVIYPALILFSTNPRLVRHLCEASHVSRCPAVFNDEPIIPQWVLFKSGSQWTWPTVSPRIPVSSKSRLTICGWHYTCCLFCHNLRLFCSFRCIYKSCCAGSLALIVLTGHICVWFMECWCNKPFIHCMPPKHPWCLSVNHIESV